ncbi:MAG: RIO1 family regulatory kinase/ATPase [Thermosphaera sp.]
MNIGLLYKSLTPRDIQVLRAIEDLSSRHEYVPLEKIEKRTKILEEHLTLVLSKLNKLRLVKRETIGGYKSFRMTTLGYDMIAIDELVKKKVLVALGDKIGVGKESEIFVGLSTGGEKVAVKFLRIGRASFRRTKILRDWSRGPRSTWYEQSKIAAEREYRALKELVLVRAKVPTPYGYNRHVVVVEYLEGVELYKRPQLSDPEAVLNLILDTLKTAYQDVGIIHSDLSEYNILINLDTEDPYIIDWPQYVYKDHPSSFELLKRDVEYIVRFFNKVYGVSLTTDEALKKIIGS